VTCSASCRQQVMRKKLVSPSVQVSPWRRHRGAGTVPDHSPHQTAIGSQGGMLRAILIALVVGFGSLAVAGTLGWRATVGVLRLWAPLLMPITPAVVIAGDCIRMLAKLSCRLRPIAAQRACHERVQPLPLEPRPSPPLACRNVGGPAPGPRKCRSYRAVRDPRTAQAIISADALGGWQSRALGDQGSRTPTSSRCRSRSAGSS
jgi:hypothetical protein